MSIVLDGTTGITTPGLTNTGTETLVNLTTTGNTILGDASTDTLNVGNGGLIKDASGNVGVGVTPNTWFSGYKVIETGSGSLVYPAASTNTQIWNNLYVNAAGNVIYKSTGIGGLYSIGGGGNAHTWYYAASGTSGTTATLTQAMTLDASGRLGVNTTSPNNTLDVVSSGDVARFGNTKKLYVSTDSSGYGLFSAAGQTGTGLYASDTSSFMYFATGSSERARIDSSGRMLLNTTTVGGGAGGSTILTAVSLSGQDAVFIKGQGSAAGNLPLGIWNDSSTGDNALLYFYTNSTISYKGGIDFNRTGGLVRYNTSSDATLKNIIGDSDGVRSLEILKSTKIREYAWKDDPTQKPQIGPIAQELYETFKGAVSVGGDIEKTDAQGNVTTEYKPWAVDKTAFSFHLVAGWQAHEKIIQEQQALIQTLTDRITALENK